MIQEVMTYDHDRLDFTVVAIAALIIFDVALSKWRKRK